MLNPAAVIDGWLGRGGNGAASARVEAAYAQEAREEEARNTTWLDWSHSELHRFCETVDQQRLQFEEEDSHANTRLAVARFLDTEVVPRVADPSIMKLPARLRAARASGTLMYHAQRQKFVTIWDSKAGLPLLCPDDAREEAMRLQRRYVPTLSAWRNGGKAIHYAVFTLPNFAPGQLRKGMTQIFKRLRSLLRAKRFPQIKGALATLEAPLGRARDWNVHLNVVLMCDGFLDYGELRRFWHWDVEIQRLRGDREAIEKTLRELVKYPVQAMPSKSAEKAAGGAIAPAMIEWTAAEWLEWWNAHRGFRRTRSYGVLFGIEDAEPESMEGFVAVGFVRHEGSRRVRRFPLLDSIPGDKSSGLSLVDRLKRAIKQRTGPPDVPPAGSIRSN